MENVWFVASAWMALALVAGRDRTTVWTGANSGMEPDRSMVAEFGLSFAANRASIQLLFSR